MPAGLSAPAVRYLLSKLPIVDRLASQLRDDPSRKTVRLVPDVEHCVACGLAGEAVPLVVKRADKCSSPTVYAEHGRLKGELNGLSCPRCSAWHSMSYAEGGTRIPAGKQVPYPGATASSRRWIQLSQSTVFENSLLDRLSAQMVHSHTGFETFCHEWAMRCGESKDRRSVACVQSCVEMRESCLPYVHAMCLPCPSHVSAAPSCAFRNDHALESS